MDNHMKELIAIGASVTANCIPCLEYHTNLAKDHGATEQEIKEAIEVAKMVRKGAMGKMDQFITTLSPNATEIKDGVKDNVKCG